MKNVLCFGDSNTYGTPPATGPDDARRYDGRTRWPGVMRKILGHSWHVIEEGLPGRTTIRDDLIEGDFKNGRRYLAACLESHRPLDVIVLNLGTNDLKARFGSPPEDVAAGVDILAGIIAATPNLGNPPARLLIVCPPPILLAGFLGVMFAGGVEKSKALPPLYEAVARRHGAEFLDAGTLVSVSPVDGIHYDKAAHRILGEAIAGKVQEMVP
ncbi:SGNH/GDSL hydrolase family protein [Labrys monachus]|uniref:Lysophospholipase L1-like esterase n=1 Tax=Labrys monachus TaxID=217067 RepID=A0ABU0FKZ4_9HYPH|nr:SGNH/GDSL hydrolase family protein [Labrys monachus]MDQ0395277.1 lysophospholipase L1-like esterase [Labrys monachus]